MSSEIYIGDKNGIARKYKSMYIGDKNGIARKFGEMYLGKSNLAKPVSPADSYSLWILGIGRTFTSGDNFKTYTDTSTITNVNLLASSACYYNGYFYAINTASGRDSIAYNGSPKICRSKDGITWTNIGNKLTFDFISGNSLQNVHLNKGPSYFIITAREVDSGGTYNTRSIIILKSSSLDLTTATWSAQKFSVNDHFSRNSKLSTNPMIEAGDYLVIPMSYGYAYAPKSTGTFKLVADTNYVNPVGNSIVYRDDGYCYSTYNKYFYKFKVGDTPDKFTKTEITLNDTNSSEIFKTDNLTYFKNKFYLIGHGGFSGSTAQKTAYIYELNTTENKAYKKKQITQMGSAGVAENPLLSLNVSKNKQKLICLTFTYNSSNYDTSFKLVTTSDGATFDEKTIPFTRVSGSYVESTHGKGTIAFGDKF